MPNPCVPFAFCNCYGPYRFEIRITLPAGYKDRLVPEGDEIVKHSEVELTLNTAYDQHPSRMIVREHGGESAVDCGATRVYRKPADRYPPPMIAVSTEEMPFHAAHNAAVKPPLEVASPDNAWLVETYLYAETFPIGYRRRVDELLRQWMGTLTTVPLPNGVGDITVEVVGAENQSRDLVSPGD